MTSSVGQFFAVDARTVGRAARECGVDAAAALLVMAAGTGRDHTTTCWSAHAVEAHAGLSRGRANAAIRTLIGGGFVEQTVGGKRPRYRLQRDSDDAEMAWMPSSFVTGTANDVSPLARLRRTRSADAIALTAGMYAAQNLQEAHGVPRQMIKKTYGQQRLDAFGGLNVLIVEKDGTLTADAASGLVCSITGPFVASEPKARRTARIQTFWRALEILERIEIFRFVAHIIEDDSDEAQAVHAISWGDGDSIEDKLGQAAHIAALNVGIRLGLPWNATWTNPELFQKSLIVAPSYLNNIQVVGIARMTHLAQTRMTIEWRENYMESSSQHLHEYGEIARKMHVNTARKAG